MLRPGTSPLSVRNPALRSLPPLHAHTMRQERLRRLEEERRNLTRVAVTQPAHPSALPRPDLVLSYPAARRDTPYGRQAAALMTAHTQAISPSPETNAEQELPVPSHARAKSSRPDAEHEQPVALRQGPPHAISGGSSSLREARAFAQEQTTAAETGPRERTVWPRIAAYLDHRLQATHRPDRLLPTTSSFRPSMREPRRCWCAWNISGRRRLLVEHKPFWAPWPPRQLKRCNV